MVHPHVLQTPSGPMQPAVFVVTNNCSARQVEDGVKGERLTRGNGGVGRRFQKLNLGFWPSPHNFFLDHFCDFSPFPFWSGHLIFVV